MIRRVHGVFAMVMVLLFSAAITNAQPGLSPLELHNMKSVTDAVMSPDGQYIAYRISVPRASDDKPGAAYSELFVYDVKARRSVERLTGSNSFFSLGWHPDGKRMVFLMRDKETYRTALFAMDPIEGDMVRLTNLKMSISQYQFRPDHEGHLAFTSTLPVDTKIKKLKDLGFDQIIYEETDWQHKPLFLVDLNSENPEPRQLTKDVTVRDFTFSPDGKLLAAATTEKNLIDYDYAFKKVHLVNMETGELSLLIDNPGKLGNFEFSPNSQMIAYTAALTQSDHAVSQVLVKPVKTMTVTNLTPASFRGHVNTVKWADNQTIWYQSAEGVYSTLAKVNLDGSGRTTLMHGKDLNLSFDTPSFSKDQKTYTFSASNGMHMGELFHGKMGEKPKRLTELNPVLKARSLGKQEVVRYKARDGQEIEGLLIYPVGYEKGKSYPFIVVVHGGPESNYYDSWLSRYANPGQVLAGRGYAVFYPNYRASTGYGIEFAAAGYGDAAGVEFDDIADGIDHFVNIGLADQKRVGLGGGSYGGFASAWFATYYTEKVKAVNMFVGISNLISKRGTTDIPYEELYVHSGKKLEEMWQQSLERSPIYHASKSKTAVQIAHGTDDPRVHPSQSLELYRRLKMNDHPAVRYVQYPGEGHGNRDQTAQIDYMLRILSWYDWYVKDGKPIDGPMPPIDVSDGYNISLD